jgi:hypothetical protein
MLYGVREQQNSSDIESLTEILTWKTDMKDGLEVKYLAKLALSLRDRPSRSAKLAWQSILGRQFLKTRPTAYIDIVKVLMGCFPPIQPPCQRRLVPCCVPWLPACLSMRPKAGHWLAVCWQKQRSCSRRIPPMRTREP